MSKLRQVESDLVKGNLLDFSSLFPVARRALHDCMVDSCGGYVDSARLQRDNHVLNIMGSEGLWQYDEMSIKHG